MSPGTTDTRPLLLFVAPYFAPAYYGGVVQVYLGLLQRLDGYRVIVVADRHGATEYAAWDEAAEERYGFSVQRIRSFELHFQARASGGPFGRLVSACFAAGEMLRFLRAGRREWSELLVRTRPDVVVCGGSYSAGWLVRRLPRSMKLVNYLHGEELTMFVRPRVLMPWMRRWQMQSLRRADLNIAVSEYTAALARSLGKVPRARIALLPNFVDTARFHATGRRPMLRARYGWEGRTVTLTLARLEPRKGIDQALRAFAQLHESGVLDGSWLYVIAGRGPEREGLEMLSRALHIEDHVSFRGFAPEQEVADLYEAADVFLQPNREINGDTEGFGIVFLEAGACGLPVIGGVAGGTADAIEEGVSGYRVDGESVEEIARALWRLIGDEGLRLKLGRQGAERVTAHFSVERASARFAGLLDGVLAGKGVWD